MRVLPKRNKSATQKELLYNPTLLKWQVDTSTWALDKKKEEYKKCTENPAYWAKNYGVIKHPIKGKIAFKLYPFQEVILKSFFKVDNLVILKSRQMGISTLIAGFCFWMACFYKDQDIIILATKGDVAKNIIEKIKVFYQYTPIWMKPKIESWNVYSIAFTNGSKVKASTTTKDAIRSEALSLLIVDEAAHIDKLHEIWTAAMPSLSTGGKAIILSTPNGAQGFFYELCMNATKQVKLPEDRKFTDTTVKLETLKNVAESRTNFTLITLPWDYHPERDKEWFEKMCQQAKYDWRTISQEYLCSFEGSGRKVIEPKVLAEIKSNLLSEEILLNKESLIDNILNTYQNDLKEVLQISDEILVYEKERFKTIFLENVKFFDVPSAKTFVAGVDVAGGGGTDYSTIIIGDLQKKIECTVKVKTDTKTFSILLYLLAKFYNHAYLFIESNSYGNDVLIRLTEDYYYDNVMKNEETGKFGFWTGKHRERLISEFIANMNYPDITHKPKINDIRIYNELETFVWKNNKPQAESGCNDDMIIALAYYLFGLKKLRYSEDTNILIPIRDSDSIDLMLEINKHSSMDWNEIIKKYNIYNISIKELKEDFDTEYLWLMNNIPSEAQEQIETYKELGIPYKKMEDIALERVLKRKNII
jgi:hypothetical protein